jgi:hypothetical protein
MRKLLLFAVSVLAVLPIAAEESKPLADAGTVTCDDHAPAGSLKWVTSRAGNAAAVEVLVAITGTGDSRHCITDWKLHVRDKDGKGRTVPVDQRDDTPEDSEWVQENSFEVDAWSNDGTMVLASQIEAQGDWDETTPIVFDFKTNAYKRVELLPLFKKLIPSGCNVVYQALGFSDDGQVLISAMSTDLEDRVPGTKACFPESRWKLDFHQNRISRVPSQQRR